MKKKWREQDIYAKLIKRFPDPAFILLPQVRDSTGFTHRPRTADAIAVSVWPSRGLYLIGIEIKTNAADWKQELANPAKSAAIQQFCRYWYIAAPKGLIDVATVPPTWGLLECDGRGTSTTRAAPELKPEPPDAMLLCSILRNVARATVPKSQVQQQIEKSVEAQSEARVKSATYNTERLRKDVKRFEEASGVKVADEWGLGDIGKAVKFVQNYGIGHLEEELQSLHSKAQSVTDAIAKQLAKAKEAHNGKNS